jgi:RNA polymerase sigma-54 factor
MVQGLQLSTRLTQSLVLAPQLQQSLALLQAPTLELKALVEQELQQNPVLEEMAPEEIDLRDQSERDSDEVAEPPDPAEPPEDLRADAVSEKEPSGPVDDFQAEFDKLVQLDQEWRDHFSADEHSHPPDRRGGGKAPVHVRLAHGGNLLHPNVDGSGARTDLTDEQRGIAELIIGNIDDYGYLKATVEEMSASTGLPPEKIAEVLKVIQTFDPPGVGARDLRECLMLQLERAGRQERSNIALCAISWTRWASGASRKSRAAPGCTVDEVQEALGRIARLEPRPGRAFLPDAINTFCPKFSCKRSATIWSSRPTTSTFRTCASAMSIRT